MKRLIRVTLTIATLALICAAPGCASPRKSVSGKWGESKYKVTPPLPCEQLTSDFILVSVPMEHDWGDGSFRGRSDSDWMILGWDTTCETSVPSASTAVLHATGTFTGSLCLGRWEGDTCRGQKKSGSFDFQIDWRVVKRCPWDPQRRPECQTVDTFVGKLMILRGYGGLEGLYGVINQWGRTGPTARWGYVNYEGPVYLDPRP